MNLKVTSVQEVPQDILDLVPESDRAVLSSSSLMVTVDVVSSGSRTGLGDVTVTLPYELKAGENADWIVVLYVADDGTVERMDAEYDAVGKTVSFVTDHFSSFVVAFEEPVSVSEPQSVNLALIAGVIVLAAVLTGAAVMMSRRQ